MTSYFISDSVIAALNGFASGRFLYAVDLTGTTVAAIGGLIRAHKLRYDIFGAFVLSVLGAVGGGTLRDVLVGGDRTPPFIFKDSTYLYLVFGVVVAGVLASYTGRFSASAEAWLGRWLEVLDAAGLAAFTIIGAKVALVAHLAWFWAPLLSACTCAGGGILRDIVCGREPAVLKGELYEELAVAGGLLYLALLRLGTLVSWPAPAIVVATVATMTTVFAARMWIVARGVKALTLGGAT